MKNMKMFESLDYKKQTLLLVFVFLLRSGFKPKRSLEIILFTSEEPTRFGISCLGRYCYFDLYEQIKD